MPKSNVDEESNRIVAEAQTWLFQPYFLNNQIIRTVVTTLKIVNIAEDLGTPPPILTVGYGALSFFVGVTSENWLADIYEQLALKIKTTTKEPTVQNGLDTLLTIRFLGQGEWEKFQLYSEKALAKLDRQPRVYRARGNLLTFSAIADHLRARYSRQLEKAEIVGQLGRMGNNVELQSWDLSGKAMTHAALGQLSALQADLDKLQHLLSSIPGSSNVGLYFHTYHARLALVLQQWDKADYHTKEVENLLSRSLIPVSIHLWGETIRAEVPLTQWQLADQSTDRAKIRYWQASAKRACGKMKQFARFYAIGKPDALRCQGDYDWLNGNPEKAKRNWQASLAVALKMDMPRHVALAHWSLGHLPGPEQSVHRQAAREILEGQGALAYFEYLETML